jgi:predicted MFS family arabinose efflux permease
MREVNERGTGIVTTIPPGLLVLLAATTGLAVACLYYAQPMLAIVGGDLAASAKQLGLVPTLTQLGYASGIFLLAPLGDRYDRRRLILLKGGVLIAALLGAAWSASIMQLGLASVAIGLAATLAQDIVPAAATLAPESARGRVVGQVMTGLLLGILLSRVVSGLVAEHLGWRSMFLIAAGSIAASWLAIWRFLPSFAPSTTLRYGELLYSVLQLWRRHEPLRRAAMAQGLLSCAFSAFWSTLAIMLHGAPFHLGSTVAGAFGLAGAFGALGAPIAGRVSDRQGPAGVARLGAAMVVAWFAIVSLSTSLPNTAQLIVLAVATIGFDLGVHIALIAHQSIVYSIDAAARSRLNSVLLVGMFIGMASGSAAASLLLARFGWTAVMLFSAGAGLVALLLRLRR